MSQLFTLEPKDPNDVIDYHVNWSGWLREGETLTASSWTVQSGLTKIADPISSVVDPFTDTNATVWVSGGTVGSSYTALNHITTSQGRQKDKTITIRVKEL